jgi:hypothetical protein
MPRRSPRAPVRPRINYHQPRFTQISEAHCGPAVIQMLLEHLGIEANQDAITEAAGAGGQIELQGTRIDQLARAVNRLGPQAQFWYKDHASLKDLAIAVRRYGYPVGVEWQGVFDDDETTAAPPAGSPESPEAEKPVKGFTLPDAETKDEDYGHYSVVTAVRLRSRLLVIADPYKDYIDKDRIFSFRHFRSRWWDYNEVPDPRTGRKKLVEDYHMMFLITEKDAAWPLHLNMKRGETLAWRWNGTH